MGCETSKIKRQPFHDENFQAIYLARHGHLVDVPRTQLDEALIVQHISAQPPNPAIVEKRSPVFADEVVPPPRNEPLTPRRRHEQQRSQQRQDGGEGDDELVLICSDCGAEILNATTPQRCSKTGKLHT